jgi:hypothetical protein
MSVYDIDYNRALPPLDAVMPYTPQLVITILFVGLSVAFLVWALYLCKKWSSWMPLLFWIGGLCACVVEPIADANLHALHAPVGQWNAFTAHGHPIPWHIFLAYPFYYGGTLIALWPMFAKRTLTRSTAWKIFWISAIWVTALEQIPLYYDVWIYYGMHPMKIGMMSLAMVIPNAASVVMAMLIMYKLLPSINEGWKRLMAIPAVAIASLGTHVGSGALIYNVMGMDLVAIGQGWLNVLGFISIGIGIVAVWMTMELTEDKSDTSRVLATAK